MHTTGHPSSIYIPTMLCTPFSVPSLVPHTHTHSYKLVSVPPYIVHTPCIDASCRRAIQHTCALISTLNHIRSHTTYPPACHAAHTRYTQACHYCSTILHTLYVTSVHCTRVCASAVCCCICPEHIFFSHCSHAIAFRWWRLRLHFSWNISHCPSTAHTS